jgi:hydrogenase maturation protease
MSVLVVGMGQPLAGDDGVGREVVRWLVAQGIAAAWAPDGAALIALLEGAARAIVIDAAVGAGPPGSIKILAPGEVPPPRHPASSHGLSVPEAIALARALGPIDVQIVAVAIDSPAAGARGLSEAVAAAVPEAAACVRDLLAAGPTPLERPPPPPGLR